MGVVLKKFNLSEYLRNPYRMVVTRDGRPVKILCTDAESKYPIVALVTSTIEGKKQQSPVEYDINGKYRFCDEESMADLFIVSEEKFSEFEDKLFDFLIYNGTENIDEARRRVKAKSPQLLELARKEIFKGIEFTNADIAYSDGYKKGYNQGMKDTINIYNISTEVKI